jgi:hypothetical protein
VGTQQNLRAVHGTGPDAVWAVGDGGTARFYNGAQWSPLSLPTTEDLNAVFALSTSDVYVAGDNGLILRYDGGDWSSPYTPAGSPRMLNIWASSPSDVYVSGTASTLLHYDGTAWKSQSLSPVFSSFNIHRVWGLGPSEVYVAAELLGGPYPVAGEVAHGGGWVYRFDGTAWSEFYTDPFQDVWSIWGSATDDIWASGDFGSIIHYDGDDWSTVWYPNTNTGKLLQSSWGSAAANIFIAGTGGLILQYSR